MGKTTLIHKTCDALQKCGIPLHGFYTEEIRTGGRRIGFDVVTLDGKRGPLARVRLVYMYVTTKPLFRTNDRDLTIHTCMLNKDKFDTFY